MSYSCDNKKHCWCDIKKRFKDSIYANKNKLNNYIYHEPITVPRSHLYLAGQKYKYLQHQINVKGGDFADFPVILFKL